MNTVTPSASDFQPGSITHILVLLTLVGATLVLIHLGRAARRRGERSALVFDRTLAVCLMTLWIILQLHDLTPGRLRWDKSLPFHICDLTGFAAPIALWTNRRAVRAMLYFWGIGLTTQAFITPTLYLGPSHLDFWTFWICHSAIFNAAIYDLVVRGYRPTWADWRLAAVTSVVYTLLILPVNIRLGVNYGFLGKSDFAQPPLVLALGEWPQRVPRIVALVCVVMAGLVPIGNVRRASTTDLPTSPVACPV